MLQDEAGKDIVEIEKSDIIEKDIIILFEEPELFLHPKLTKELRTLIYEVSKTGSPFQVLCASHSPQMIDISKDHTSLVRMIQKEDNSTELHQVKQEDIIENDHKTIPQRREEAKQKLQEILRFNPFICESFYADEVVLVEGDTEAIIWRAYIEEFGDSGKDIFVVNCGGVTNIPLYQKIFSKFNIKYSVICDTDHIKYENKGKDKLVIKNSNINGWNGRIENPIFTGYIQKSIQDQFEKDMLKGVVGKFFVFKETFEPAHEALVEPFKYEGYTKTEGKPFGANKYWEKILKSREESGFLEIPIIKYIQEILKF